MTVSLRSGTEGPLIQLFNHQQKRTQKIKEEEKKTRHHILSRRRLKRKIEKLQNPMRKTN